MSINTLGYHLLLTRAEADEFRALREFFEKVTSKASGEMTRDEILSTGYGYGGEGDTALTPGFRTACGYGPDDFISPYVKGFDTVLGYLAKRNDPILLMMDETPEATQRDGFWLMHRARERGLPVIKVTAPKFLQDQGITQVNAYPLTLLEERLG